jgi:hypothetical protein
MSAETLSLIAGTVLSLAFSYLPGVSDWYAALEATNKRLVMLGLLVLSTGAVFGLACAGWGAEFGLDLSCDRRGLLGLVQQLVLAIIANQGVYAISPHFAKAGAEPLEYGSRTP